MLPNRTPDSLYHALPINPDGCSSEALRNDTARCWRDVIVRSESDSRNVVVTSRALATKRPPRASSDVLAGPRLRLASGGNAAGHQIEQTPMSGVVGYWGYSSQDLTEAVFAAFTHSLAHRGPDGFGIEHFTEARLWLGHRRLAIVDLSVRGRQPMSYAEGRYWLTYNGVVYNYLEVREELRGLGHRFVSDSDSEVILAAYAQWGPECQLRFNGMWAFAIWDFSRAPTVFVARPFRRQATAL